MKLGSFGLVNPHLMFHALLLMPHARLECVRFESAMYARGVPGTEKKNDLPLATCASHAERSVR